MTDDWAQAEGERMLANMIRVGVVTQVDAANGLAKMKVGGLNTDWLPWGVARAGGTRTASAPTVGEQRLVFAPYGDTGQAVIGQALYQDDHPTPTASGQEDVTVYPDGTRISYSSATNTLQIDVAAAGKVVVNCKEATVNAETSVTLTTPETNLSGNLTVGGNATFNGTSVTHGGKNIGKTHTHQGQASAPSGPVVSTGQPN
jgi:phage baseplate assembly protein V